MNERKYLNEERYHKVEKKLTVIAIALLVIGLSIGGFLIYKGTEKPSTEKINELKSSLEEKRKALLDKGIAYDEFADYTDGEAYDLKIITKALDPSFDYCEFDEYENNAITKDYCQAKNKLDSNDGMQLKMFGISICVAACMFAGFIFSIAKRRSILAFTAQQTIPVVKEGMDEIAPNIGNVAKEISKGLAEGSKEVTKK